MDGDGIVVDIGRAAAQLRKVLDDLDRRNLDDEPSFAARNSTTESLALHIADRLAERVTAGTLGTSGTRVTGLAVTLHESPVASACYERSLEPG